MVPPAEELAWREKAPETRHGIRVDAAFDGGLCPQYELTEREIRFRTTSGQSHLHVRLSGFPEGFRVVVIPDEEGKNKLVEHFKTQGLYVSRDGVSYESRPFAEAAEAKPTALSLTLEQSGETWVSNNLPYGRDDLDQLLADTRGVEGMSVVLLRRNRRLVPMFEFGRDDGRLPVHYIVGGECAWEAAALWTGDAIVRRLASDRTLRESLAARAVVRVIPALSIYSSVSARNTATTTLDDRGVYGASTWNWERPPVEIALVRELVLESLREGRLGCLLTIHSWYGLRPYSGLEAIQSAGANKMEGERLRWTRATLETLIREVPAGRVELPKKSWHPGLARDYLLREFGFVSFRIEVTTAKGGGRDAFTRSGEALIRNLAQVGDWSPARMP